MRFGNAEEGATPEALEELDGRDAIRIVAPASASVLVVDAATYEPIEWRTTSDEGTLEMTRFLVYEQLPATPANEARS